MQRLAKVFVSGVSSSLTSRVLCPILVLPNKIGNWVRFESGPPGLPDEPSLWIQFQSATPVLIGLQKAKIVSDFLRILKKELSPGTDAYSFSDLDLVKPDGDIALRSDDIKSFLTTVSYDAPLILAPPREKIIYIRDVDEELRPLTSFMQVSVECDADVKQILERKGSALVSVTEPLKQVTKFKHLKDGGKYYVYSRYEQSMLDEVRWQQGEVQG